jgi:hypothetical protein
MEVLNRVIVSFVYYNSLVRDTLEYTIPKDNFDVNYYKFKQNGIINEIKLNTPLKTFLEKNGENGQKLKEKLEKFGEDFYSEKSTVIKLSSDGLRVDKAQAVKIFASVVPLHEELQSVIDLHVKYANENKLLDERVAVLHKADDRYYRAIAMLTLSGELFRQFEEYNKARKDANGQLTPQSNFIQNELQQLVQFVATVLNYAKCTDILFTAAKDALNGAIEMMNGRRDLPVGKNFRDVINDFNVKMQSFVTDSEKSYRETYTPLLNEMIEDTRKLAAEHSAQQGAPAATEAKPETTGEGGEKK